MGTVIDIVIPADQREGTQSTIARWLKREGDAVVENEPIVEINTDKVTLEVAAPKTGTLVKILKGDGEDIELTEVLGSLELTEGGAVAAKAEAQKAGSQQSVKAPDGVFSPAVRALAKDLGVDPKSVRGTGKEGRVTAKDIEDAAARPAPVTSRGSSKRAHSPMRRSIAAHMVESVSTVPHVTSVFEADFSAVAADRLKRDPEFSANGVKLTVTSYLVRAAVKALLAVPEANSRWHDEYLELLPDYHIGIATAVDDAQGGGAGLVVPVIKDAGTLSLFEIAQALHALTEKARAGKLKPADLSGATFSISNHGMSGSLLAAPIIIPKPQTAILGVGKVEKRVFAPRDGEEDDVVIRPAAYVTLTIDHRALDGFTANKFLTAFTHALRNPD